MSNRKFPPKADQPRAEKIAVAMSGGVDSSVAAKLLKDQGHDVVGIFLYFWKEENSPNPSRIKRGTGFYQGGNFDLSSGALAQGENKCCSAEALLDARRVADKIGIPLYTLNFAQIFKKQVVDNFLDEYDKGRTPNPCVRCNKLVKLGFLIKQAKKLGFDYVATGHYVKRVESHLSSAALAKGEKSKVKSIYKLYKAKDKNKDQSYFLYTFNQNELGHLLFPLGNYTKPEVRRMAKKFKLPVAEKPESQEICFIPGKSHNEFLKRHLKLKSGLIRIAPLIKGGRGIIIGKHQGLPLYTIGQRKGINIGGIGPFYAARMDYKKNILYVVNKSDDPLIYKNELVAGKVNWLNDYEPKFPLKCEAIIRYHHRPAKCVVTKINNHNFKVKFSAPQRAITPGQSAVFYAGQEVIGGGVIK